jgi:hypothetical protein
MSVSVVSYVITSGEWGSTHFPAVSGLSVSLSLSASEFLSLSLCFGISHHPVLFDSSLHPPLSVCYLPLQYVLLLSLVFASLFHSHRKGLDPSPFLAPLRLFLQPQEDITLNRL